MKTEQNHKDIGVCVCVCARVWKEESAKRRKSRRRWEKTRMEWERMGKQREKMETWKGSGAAEINSLWGSQDRGSGVQMLHYKHSVGYGHNTSNQFALDVQWKISSSLPFRLESTSRKFDIQSISRHPSWPNVSPAPASRAGVVAKKKKVLPCPQRGHVLMLSLLHVGWKVVKGQIHATGCVIEELKAEVWFKQSSLYQTSSDHILFMHVLSLHMKSDRTSCVKNREEEKSLNPALLFHLYAQLANRCVELLDAATQIQKSVRKKESFRSCSMICKLCVRSILTP